MNETPSSNIQWTIVLLVLFSAMIIICGFNCDNVKRFSNEHFGTEFGQQYVLTFNGTPIARTTRSGNVIVPKQKKISNISIAKSAILYDYDMTINVGTILDNYKWFLNTRWVEHKLTSGRTIVMCTGHINPDLFYELKDADQYAYKYNLPKTKISNAYNVATTKINPNTIQLSIIFKVGNGIAEYDKMVYSYTNLKTGEGEFVKSVEWMPNETMKNIYSGKQIKISEILFEHNLIKNK